MNEEEQIRADVEKRKQGEVIKTARPTVAVTITQDGKTFQKAQSGSVSSIAGNCWMAGNWYEKQYGKQKT